jgi:hypothetical protein
LNLDLKLYQLIEKEIGEHLEKHAAELVMGKPLNFEDYRFRVGVIRGLRDALSIAEEANREAIGLSDKER